jgi:Lrp/AsnC family transcriptional regulator for asnA, asnC and gidA
MLDNFDRQLILALQKDGRATHVELATLLGSHVSTIAKRMKALEENESMKVRALPNPSKLGYSAHALVAIETRIPNVERIVDRLNKNFNINLIVTTFGRYNILAIAFFSDWDKLFDMIATDLSSIEGTKVAAFLVKDIKKRHYGFNVANIEPVKLDEIDKQIIEKLTENGRLKNQRLAEMHGLSPPTCLRRVSRLLNEGVIEIKAMPNPSQIGYSANAFLFLRTEPSKLEEICFKLSVYEKIYLVMTLHNSFDLVVSFNASTPEELYKFQNKILSVDGVLGGDIIIRAEIKKRYYGGFLR